MVPGLRHECRRHAPCRDALWRQQPPYCRKLLQGTGARFARGARDRPAPEGPHTLDQRIAERLMVMIFFSKSLRLRWPRNGPRSIHQDKAPALRHTLRGSLRSHLRVRVAERAEIIVL